MLCGEEGRYLYIEVGKRRENIITSKKSFIGLTDSFATSANDYMHIPSFEMYNTLSKSAFRIWTVSRLCKCYILCRSLRVDKVHIHN